MKPGNHRLYGAKSHRIFILEDEETELGKQDLFFLRRGLFIYKVLMDIFWVKKKNIIII